MFRVTEGLQRKYGEHRVLDTPIAEGGIIAAAIGMGVNGLRPVAEIQFADYIYPACDQIVSELARLRYRSAGEFWAPVTIRTPCGGGIRGGQTHSQSPEGIFTHVCGIKVVMPSNPYDAKGLLIAAIEDDDPVVFFEPKRLYNGPFDGDPNKPAVPWSTHPKGEVPEGYYTVPIGSAEIVRAGSAAHDRDLRHDGATSARPRRAGSGSMPRSSTCARWCRSTSDTICTSVSKTGRCVIAHEATRFWGFGAELSATIQEQCFWDLEAPIQRVAGWDTPYPHAFEWEYFPGPERVAIALKKLMEVVMSRYVFKMPDLGEGTVEAEIVAWHVKPGDTIAGRPDHGRSHDRQGGGRGARPVTGKVVALNGAPGDMVPRRCRADRVRDGCERR